MPNSDGLTLRVWLDASANPEERRAACIPAVHRRMTIAGRSHDRRLVFVRQALAWKITAEYEGSRFCSRPRQRQKTRWGQVSSADMDLHVTTGTGRADQPATVPCNARGPGPGISATTIPLAGEPGHGLGAIVRRQRIPIGQGRADGGNNALFDLICYDCGDDPCWDYSQLSFQLQRTRGPYTMQEALAAYERHLGLGR